MSKTTKHKRTIKSDSSDILKDAGIVELMHYEWPEQDKTCEVVKYSNGVKSIVFRYDCGESWLAYCWVPRSVMIAEIRELRRPTFCFCMLDCFDPCKTRPSAKPVKWCWKCCGKGYHQKESLSSCPDAAIKNVCTIRLDQWSDGPGCSFSRGGHTKKIGRHGLMFSNSGGLDI